MLTGNKGHNKVIHVNNSLEMIWEQSSVRDAIENSTLFVIALLIQTLEALPSSMPVYQKIRLEGRTHIDCQEDGFAAKSVFQKYKLHRKQNVTENPGVIEAKQKSMLFKMWILLTSTYISMTDLQGDTQSDTSQNVIFPWQVG